MKSVKNLMISLKKRDVSGLFAVTKIGKLPVDANSSHFIVWMV